jgi:uncharacterized protein with ParB-like and HNH nuclease domain
MCPGLSYELFVLIMSFLSSSFEYLIRYSSNVINASVVSNWPNIVYHCHVMKTNPSSQLDYSGETSSLKLKS